MKITTGHTRDQVRLHSGKDSRMTFGRSDKPGTHTRMRTRSDAATVFFIKLYLDPEKIGNYPRKLRTILGYGNRMIYRRFLVSRSLSSLPPLLATTICFPSPIVPPGTSATSVTHSCGRTHAQELFSASRRTGRRGEGAPLLLPYYAVEPDDNTRLPFAAVAKLVFQIIITAALLLPYSFQR